jgi:hypothetical protein
VPRAHVPELLLDEDLDRAYSPVGAVFVHPPPIVRTGCIVTVEHQPAVQLHRMTNERRASRSEPKRTKSCSDSHSFAPVGAALSKRRQVSCHVYPVRCMERAMLHGVSRGKKNAPIGWRSGSPASARMPPSSAFSRGSEREPARARPSPSATPSDGRTSGRLTPPMGATVY